MIFPLAIILYWVAVGIREGYGVLERYSDVPIAESGRYHAYRLAEGAGVILAILFYSGSLLELLGAWLIGWSLYEKVLSFVVGRKTWGSPHPYKVFGTTFTIPAGTFFPAVLLIGVLIYVYSKFLIVQE